jgi:hypothetical protein
MRRPRSPRQHVERDAGVVKSAGNGSPNRLLFPGLAAAAAPTATASAASRAGQLHLDGERTELLRDGQARDADVVGRDVAVPDAVPRLPTFVYKICEYNTAVCSSTASVTF